MNVLADENFPVAYRLALPLFFLPAGFFTARALAAGAALPGFLPLKIESQLVEYFLFEPTWVTVMVAEFPFD